MARAVREIVFALAAAAGPPPWRQLARQGGAAAAYGGYKDASEAWAAGVLAVGGRPTTAAAVVEGKEMPQALRERWEERAAIMAYDGKLPRAAARRGHAHGLGAPPPRERAPPPPAGGHAAPGAVAHRRELRPLNNDNSNEHGDSCRMVSLPQATIFQETPMLVFPHHTDHIAQTQPPLVGETWATAVVPRLPATLAAQARTLKAFQRVRGLATPHDLRRGILASVLGPLSTRRRGAWAVLVGVAEIAETAWRKRLRARNPWRLWLLSALVATSAPPDPLGARPQGRMLLVDASCLGQPGGTGDDGRLPLAYDFTAGRLGQVQGTDRRGGAHLERSTWPPGEVIVGDRGSGARRSVALAVRQHADVILRIHPATFPLETEAGAPFAVLRWLRHRGDTTREWHGWCRWQGCR